MSKVDKAFARLEKALGTLDAKIEAAADQARMPEPDSKDTDHEILAAEVSRLKARSVEETQLRGEAADAVRAALGELRAMAAQTGGEAQAAGGVHG